MSDLPACLPVCGVSVCRPVAPQPSVVGVDGLGGPWVPHYDDERVPEEVLRSQSIGAAEEDQRRADRHADLGEGGAGRQAGRRRRGR